MADYGRWRDLSLMICGAVIANPKLANSVDLTKLIDGCQQFVHGVNVAVTEKRKPTEVESIVVFLRDRGVEIVEGVTLLDQVKSTLAATDCDAALRQHHNLLNDIRALLTDACLYS